MNVRLLACLAAVGGIAFVTAPNAASAATLDGLTLEISKPVVQQNNVVIPFVLTNTTKTRVYIMDVQMDDAQKAMLASGTSLSQPQAVMGIEKCGNSSVHVCLENPVVKDLDNFSAVEPGKTLEFSFTYGSMSAIASTDKISFSVATIARFAVAGGDSSDAGRPKAEKFPFKQVPLQ